MRPQGAGPLVRGGRAVGRAAAVWLLTTGALVLLDRLLAGFAMTDWWQPTVLALALGVLSAVVWPLLLRVALPLALFTLGVAAYLVLGAALLGVSFAIPGVTVADLPTAVVVAVVMSVVGAVVSWLLGIDTDELFFRRAARRPGATEGVDDRPPGVLFLQVDGLGHDTLRRALRTGEMPALARWLDGGSHRLTHWHTDWSSQTGAGVCGALHGSSDGIVGFRWYEKDTDHVMSCGNPEDAAEIERRHSDGRGLLAVDGAAHGLIFTGDAPFVSLTTSAVPLLTGRKRRRGRGGATGYGYFAYFANPVHVLRTLVGAVREIVRELRDSARQARADVRPRVPRGLAFGFVRAGSNVIARDVVVSAVLEDMLAGRAAVYADFIGYDEMAHFSGIERWDALRVLRDIDRQIGRLHRATRLAPRRYLVVALSDHGQTQGTAFVDRFGETVEALVGRLCGGPDRRGAGVDDPAADAASRAGRSDRGWQAGAVLAEAATGAATGGLVARRLRARVEGRAPVPTGPHRDGAVPRVAPGVVAVASGHVAMASFPDHPGRVELETIEAEHPDLLPGLVDHPGVGFVLVRSAVHGPVVLGRDGLHRLATGVVVGDDPLRDYGPHAAELVRRVDAFANCPDVLLNSRYDPVTDEAPPLEHHVGSHGGLGGTQSRGFLLHPASLPAPEELLGHEVVGAADLHRVLRGWLTHLGHPLPGADRPAAAGPVGPGSAQPDAAAR